MAKSGNGSMGALQERGKAEFPGGKVNQGTGLSKGDSGGGVNTSKGLDKFDNAKSSRGEYAQSSAQTDGLSK